MSCMSFESVGRSPAFRVVAIGALILCLQVPVLFTYGMLTERESTKRGAVREIGASWGLAQEVVGPYLVVPYRIAGVTLDEEGKTVTAWKDRSATFLPESLDIEANLDGQVRNRGIYEASVYGSQIAMSGSFARPDFSAWGVLDSEVRWDQARLILEITDSRGFRDSVEVDWAGTVFAFEPGERTLPGNRQAVQVVLGEDAIDDAELPFRMNFTLNGSERIRFAPVGRRTATHISGTWPNPSFQGAWLPEVSDVASEVFSATWTIPSLGRNFPQSWTGSLTNVPSIAQYGVDLLTPVDAYRQTERSLKYELLFLALTFAPLWLFEVLAGIRLHFIQYGLIGTAVCLFYLLELSLSEHIGFVGAYTIAASMIAGLVTSYAWSILGSVSRAASMGGIISGLYGFLYVLISLEDFALLAGSLALFLVLAALMYATRRVDWFQLGRPQTDAS
jgi:inner membrane protein